MGDNMTVELVGVRIRTDGTKDFSRAMTMDTDKMDKPRILGVKAVLSDAAAVGVSEPDLRNLSGRLSGHAGSVIDRRSDINSFSKEHGLQFEASRNLVRAYAKEKVKEMERGELRHYHQMPINKVESVVSDKAILSTDTQKALGRKTGGTSRPDVVQMTRDRFDTQGKLVKEGLGAAYLTGENMVTWVFKPRIMDLPGYDCTGEYPDLPSIPLQSEYVEAVLVADKEKVAEVRGKLELGGILTKVLTREEWKQERAKY